MKHCLETNNVKQINSSSCLLTFYLCHVLLPNVSWELAGSSNNQTSGCLGGNARYALFYSALRLSVKVTPTLAGWGVVIDIATG
jgi:hypothetical protein